MTREERGRALNDQRANVVADIAAVLGGLGKGNKIWLELTEAEKKAGTVEPKLCEAKVYWTNTRDRCYAASWPSNVTHFVGLPGRDEESVQLDVQPEPVVEETEKKEGEATEGEDKAVEVEGKKEGAADVEEGKASSKR